MNRNERRRRLKEDERALARGLDADAPDGPQIMVLMRLFHARIEESREEGSLAPLGDFIGANLKAAWRAEPKKALACRMGCAHCCHAWVSAKAPEVLLGKAAIPPRERAGMRAAVEAGWSVTGTAGPQERARMAAPCPMLAADGRCTIYAARPATCRTAVSLDAAVCARAFRPDAEPIDIPMPDFHIVMRRGYSIALAGALKQAGFAAASYEFVGALRAALARPDAEAAWLAGEDVFAGVQTDPGSDPFDHPKNRRVYELAWRSIVESEPHCRRIVVPGRASTAAACRRATHEEKT